MVIYGYFYYQRQIERKQVRLQKKSHSHILELIVSGEALSEVLQAIVRDVEAENPAMLCRIYY